jgi:(E)-4-hydroxy-3-methylbut-2-enyl-diphosphate synthase
VKDGVNLPAITAFRLLAAKLKRLGRNNPILLKDCINFGSGTGVSPVSSNPNQHTGETPVPLPPNIALLQAGVVIGSLLADGIGDAILVRGESGGGQSLRLAFNILQAAGCRSFKTDYVACPSCGRTLFNLQTVTAKIKARTEHLKGVKIAIMGCIVNGPGEMADADFGYVGGAPNKINLYVGKQAIKFNIPEAEAVERLVDLIKEHNKWVEPEEKA